MLQDFTGKNVVITGGSRGIGRSCAKLFADLNANVIITFKSNENEAKRTLEILAGSVGNHSMYVLDVADPLHVERCFGEIVSKYEQLDVLVNNAGIYIEHKINSISYYEWQKAWNDTISTNLLGVSNLCYFAARQMIKQKKGKIVNISSRGAFRGEPDHPAYGASKAGLNAMSQSLAVALAPFGITVGIVAPGLLLEIRPIQKSV